MPEDGGPTVMVSLEKGKGWLNGTSGVVDGRKVKCCCELHAHQNNRHAACVCVCRLGSGWVLMNQLGFPL